MKDVRPPCGKYCDRRKQACAVGCKEWADYVAERNAAYEQRREESITAAYYQRLHEKHMRMKKALKRKGR
jgi:hypothetical protein